MRSTDKYTGEVWFPGNQGLRQFAIITFNNDNLIIETNLCSNTPTYKESIIYGEFTGLGNTTFIDCIVLEASRGMISSCIYQPRFSFVSLHRLIDIDNIKMKKFKVINETIADWVDKPPSYNLKTNELELEKFEDVYSIDDICLSITLSNYPNISRKKRKVLYIENKGEVSFKTVNDISIIEAIELYDKFQKVLQLLKGGSKKFMRFTFKCDSCEYWDEVYYNDGSLSNSNNRYVVTQYTDVKNDLNIILKAIYTNDKFQFCLDKLMENLTSINVSNSRRFLNSIVGYEAYCKNYMTAKKSKVNLLVERNKEIFFLIGKIKEEDWEGFPAKIVRSRDYYTHSNIGNKDIFSELELLYISHLFDLVIGYLLLQKLDVSNALLHKFVLHGNRVYTNSQRINEHLNNSILR